MKSYLVTGGCGFIGRNLVARLISQGNRVRVLDNLSLGRREDLASFDVEIVAGDVRDLECVQRAARGAETIVHLAAHTRVVESVSDPAINFEVNAFGTLNVLRACVAANVEKFIFASTGGAILGEQQPPVHEGMVPSPKSPYGASKLAGEGYCSAFHGSYGLPTVALRFSNVYGPFSYHKGSVVAQFFRNLIHQQPLVVYGDGQQTRDFLYVDDLVNAILLADQANVAGEVFQIAAGQETSIGRLIELMRGVVGSARVNVRYEPARAGEVRRNFASIEKARELLGYDPQTDLSPGLERVWEWFCSCPVELAAR
jgi:UDP-glucose 4-epimerase